MLCYEDEVVWFNKWKNMDKEGWRRTHMDIVDWHGVWLPYEWWRLEGQREICVPRPITVLWLAMKG